MPLVDIVGVGPEYIGPTLKQNTDIWGVRRRAVSYGSGEYDEIEYGPLANAETIDDVLTHQFPDPDWFDYSGISAAISTLREERERAVMASNGNIFESSWYMRGFEKMFMDFVLNPDLAHIIMEKVTNFHVEYFTRILEAAEGEIDLVFTADDLGGQSGLLMSQEMWAEFIKPHHVRLNKVIHEYAAKVIYHTDGSVMQVVDGLIDMGIDVLQALQFSADGMDPGPLKTLFGDRLCFEGGVSVQTTLPNGTPEEVASEVKDLISILGRDGGYILGPSHAIQAGTPPQNIVAMFDTAAGVYPHD